MDQMLEKRLEADRKMAEMQEKNLKIIQRFEEVEKDKRMAQARQNPAGSQPAKPSSTATSSGHVRDWDRGKKSVDDWRENVPNMEQDRRPHEKWNRGGGGGRRRSDPREKASAGPATGGGAASGQKTQPKPAQAGRKPADLAVSGRLAGRITFTKSRTSDESSGQQRQDRKKQHQQPRYVDHDRRGPRQYKPQSATEKNNNLERKPHHKNDFFIIKGTLDWLVRKVSKAAEEAAKKPEVRPEQEPKPEEVKPEVQNSAQKESPEPAEAQPAVPQEEPKKEASPSSEASSKSSSSASEQIEVTTVTLVPETIARAEIVA